MITKIAAADLDHLLVKSASIMRAQEAEISSLRAQLAGKDRESHAEKIASIAVERGIMSVDDAESYAKSLAASTRDLSMVEEFVSKSTGPGMNLGEDLHKEASADSDLPIGDTPEGRFASFLLSSDLA